MRKEYKRFCNKYKEKLKNDKEINMSPDVDLYDCRDRIHFDIVMYTWSPVTNWIGDYRGENLITLDNEDLQYFYDKYSNKIIEELNSEVKELEQEIEKVK